MNCENISLTLNGFSLNGVCLVDPGVDNCLVALAGADVAGLVMLPSVSTGASNKVEFCLDLDPRTVLKHVGQTISLILFSKVKRTLVTLPCSQIVKKAGDIGFNVEDIAPSYGFVGGVKLEPLVVYVNSDLESIILTVEEKANYLNIRALRIFDDEGNPIELDHTVNLLFSSSLNEQQKASSFNAGEGFHSKLEDNPWLTLTFSTPKKVGRLEITYRADKWGIRSRRLTVSVKGPEDEGPKTLYNAYSRKALAQFHASLVALTGPEVLIDSDIQNIRRKALRRACKEIERTTDVNRDSIFALSLQLLSTWSNEKSMPEIHKLELELLSKYIFYKTKSSVGSTLTPFSGLLASRADLDFLESEINSLRTEHCLERIQLTKHGIAHEGILSKNVPRVLDTIETVVADLEQMGLRPCLAYGTLLGAVRNKSFIPHDDDVDLLIEFSESGLDRYSVYALTNKLLEDLDHNKYNTKLEVRTDQNLNIHIQLKATNIVIDVFPYWHADEQSQLHMESMKIRGIPLEILEDRCEVELYNRRFPAPGKPEQFLYERYGEGWTISDRYHEWPWPLEE